jgi:hypothetical protein
MTALLVGLLLLVVVVLLSRQKRVRARSCCSTDPWPPVDLIDERADA